MANPLLERLRYHVSGAIERGEAQAIAGIPAFSLDFQGWHIWQDSRGRIIANGPDQGNRRLEFASIESAADWLAHTGKRELAAAIRERAAQ